MKKKDYVKLENMGFYYGMPKQILKELLEKDGYEPIEKNGMITVNGRFLEEDKTKIETYGGVAFTLEENSVASIKGVRIGDLYEN